jgi:hypothetical protein
MNANQAPRSNPFSTRFIAPGVIPYWLAPPQTLESLARQLVAHRRASVIGPHGSGKSSLMNALVQPPAKEQPVGHQAGSIERLGGGVLNAMDQAIRLQWWTIDGPASRRRFLAAGGDWDRQQLVVVDGWERLRSWERWRVLRRTAVRDCMLLVSSHQPIRGLPILWDTHQNLQHADQLVRWLLRDDPELADRWIASPRYAELKRRWGGNVREMFFTLYDWFELQHGHPSSRSDRAAHPHLRPGVEDRGAID